MVFGNVLRLVTAGAVLCVPLVVVAGYVLRNVLFGIDPYDVRVLAVTLVASVAGWGRPTVRLRSTLLRRCGPNDGLASPHLDRRRTGPERRILAASLDAAITSPNAAEAERHGIRLPMTPANIAFEALTAYSSG